MTNHNTPPKERPDWPLPSFDAKDWAKAFCRRFIITHRAGYDTKAVDDDEGLMLTWFANALMRGFDEHAARSAAERALTAPPATATPQGAEQHGECNGTRD